MSGAPEPGAGRTGRAVRRGARVAAGLGLLGVAILGVEVQLARTREYLPTPEYALEATVQPAGGTRGEEPLRLLVLGDSTAAGVGSPTLDQSLPVQVAQRVADRLGRPVAVQGRGVSGARTGAVRTAQVPDAVDDVGAVDVVLVVVGSNDVTHLTPLWQMADRTERMLRAVEAFDAPVVLGGIPLFTTVPALDQPLRAVVSAYAGPYRDAQAEGAARVEAATYVPIATLASPRFLGRPGAMSSDGFHPSAIGYGFWADALAPAVAEAAAG